MTAQLKSHTEGQTLVLTLSNPDYRNALGPQIYTAGIEALNAAESNGDIRSVVITGEGAHFSAGGQLNRLQENRALPPEHQAQSIEALHGWLETIATFPKPLLAAVCGPAVGIGTTMLLHCDLVYAGDNAMFSMPFVNLGLCPEAASSLLVPRLMGYQRAAEVLLMGDPFMAEAALEVGLVNRVVPPTEANALAQQQARRLATKPLSSVIETKRLLKASTTPAVLERMREEGAIFGRMLQEPAAKEAFSAFLDKRKPDFSSL